jgi:predicted O-methyltransferase YrrM
MKSLTRRQVLALGAVAVIGAAIGVAAVLDQVALTTALVGLLVAVVFAAAVVLRQRVSQLEATTRALLGEVRSLAAGQDRLEFAQRRIIGAVESERLADADRWRESQAAIEHTRHKILETIKTSRERLVRSGRDQTSEVEALLQLFQDFQPRAPMPLSGHWALNATGLLELMFLLNTKHPKVVLELGSGTSTVWMAYAMERIGGRIVSVDHDRAYANRTRWLLNAHGLDGVAEVREAPLSSVNVDGEEFQWYDMAAFEEVGDIDFLMVDGPPGGLGQDARYPALRILESRLSPVATVVLDDAYRADEQHIIARWLETVDGLEREHEVLGHQAVFTYSRPQADSGR